MSGAITPLPWKLIVEEETLSRDEFCEVIGSCGENVTFNAGGNGSCSVADGKMIVLAVNAFQALVDGCTLALESMQFAKGERKRGWDQAFARRTLEDALKLSEKE